MMRLSCCLLFWSILTPGVFAQAVWPMLHSPSPCAVQVGTTAECVYSAGYAENGAFGVTVSGRGVTGEVIDPPPGATSKPKSRGETNIKVRFTVAADAPVGIRDVRLLTPNGPSSVGHVVVVRDPVVREKNPNGTMKEAQAVTVPVTLCGAIEERVDVDFYKFNVKAGDALTFHVICQRLLNKLTAVTTCAAPMITLRNASGTVLASNDYFFGGDAVLHYRFQTAGEYYLDIRDVRYEGSRYWEYAIEIHDRPFVTTISPACLPPGVPTKVRLIGFNLPADPFVTLTLPADAPDWQHWLQLPNLAGQPLNSVLVRPSALPVVHEASTPNDTPAQAQAITMPAAIAGVIERTDDVDYYAFQARKGQRFTFQIHARTLNSALDSMLRILNEKGETLAENDDASDKTGRRESRNEILCPDSRIESWEAPADGRYFIEVSDVHGRGGERFVYSLLARPSQPHFLLETSTDRTMIAPGSAGVIFVRSIRKEGFTDDIQLAIEGLPPGVTAVCGPIPSNCQDGCILLRADGARPRSFANVRVVGKSPKTPNVVARPYGELMRDGGARYLVPVDEHLVGVIDAVDIKTVRFTPAEITLKPGEMKKIDVAIERRPGFVEPVVLTVMSSQTTFAVYGNCLPEGVTIDPSSQVRLTGNQLTGTLVFKAEAHAKPCRQLVPIITEVSINFPLRMYFPGDPFWLTVEAPAKK